MCCGGLVCSAYIYGTIEGLFQESTSSSVTQDSASDTVTDQAVGECTKLTVLGFAV